MKRTDQSALGDKAWRPMSGSSARLGRRGGSGANSAMVASVAHALAEEGAYSGAPHRRDVWRSGSASTRRALHPSQLRGGCIRKRSAPRRGRTAMICPYLIFLLLLVLPGRTQHVEHYPTQLAIVSAPFLATGTIPGGLPFGPSVVEIKDADYETVAVNDGNFLRVSLVGGQSGLSAGKTSLRFGVDAHDGVGNFSSLTVDKVCAGCRLRFVYKSLQVLSDVFDVVPSAPYAIDVAEFPTRGISAVPLSPQPAIRVVDKGGNFIPTIFQAKIYKAEPVAVQNLRQLNNDLTVMSAGGTENRATFDGIFMETPSTNALGFNATFSNGAVLNLVVPGLDITGKVSSGQFQTGFIPIPNQTSSLPFSVQPVITLVDWTEKQVRAQEAQIQVTATLHNGTVDAMLLGTTVVTSEGGLAKFTDLAIDKSGNDYAVKFSFISCPAQGSPCDSLRFVCSSLSEPCPPLADFSLGGYISAFVVTSSFNVAVGLASMLQIEVQPSLGVVAENLNPATVVKILDAGGNTVKTAATVTASLAANHVGAELISAAEHKLVSAVNGVATFPELQIDKTGTGFRLLFASSNEAGLRLQSYSNPITITAAAIKSITVSVQPGSALRGSPLSIQPRVAVLDRFGNYALEDEFVKTVTAELVGVQQVGTLGGQLVQKFVSGFATFTDLSVNNPAVQYKLRFYANGTWDTSNPKVGTGMEAIDPPIVAESESFQILGLVSGLRVQQQPEQAYGGSSFEVQPRVALVDLNGQVVASASNTVRATVVAGPAGFADVRPVPALQSAAFGVVQFTDLTLDVAGSGYILEFEILGLGEIITTLTSDFSVAVGQPHALEVLTQPTDAVAAVQIEPHPAVKLVDAGGNTISFNGQITTEVVHSSSTQTFIISMSNGIAKFSEAINTAGSGFHLIFSLAQIEAKSDVFGIARGAAAVLDILTQPSHGIVDQPLTRIPVVQVKDAGGNILVDYTHAIIVTRAEGPSASYPAGNLSIMPLHGQASFDDLSVTGTARTYRLRFSTTEPTLTGPKTISVESEPFTITFAPVQLKVQNPPGPRDDAQLGGELFNFHPIVSFLDSEGQVVKSRTSNIAMSLPAEDGLSGTLNLSATEGVAEFTDLIIAKAKFPASHTIVISSIGETLATTLNVVVKAGSAASLTLTKQPQDAMSGLAFFAPVVLSFLDFGGNVVTGQTAQENVVVQLKANKFGGTLQGTLTVAPVSGVVTFNDLQITGIGNGFSLLFISDSFLVESVSFGVHGEPKSLGLMSFPAGAIIHTGATGFPKPYLPAIRVALLDDAKNIITGGRRRPPFAEVTIGIDTDPSGDLDFATSEGTTTAIFENGMATFDRVLLITDNVSPSLQGIRFRFDCNITGIFELQSPFLSTSGWESQLKFERQMGQEQSSGLSLSPMPTLTIRGGDTNPQIIRGSQLPVTVSLKNAGGAVLQGATTINASAGVYVFTDLSISTATAPGQFYALEFRVPCDLRDCGQNSLLGIESQPFTVSVGSPASISMHSELVPSASGTPFLSQPCIALRDAGSNLVQGQDFAVTASLIASAHDEALQIGQNIVLVIEGFASFTDLGITNLTHGSFYQISFSSGLLEVRSAAFTGFSGPPAMIEVISSPDTSIGGSTLRPSPSFKVTDAGGTPVTGLFQMVASLHSNPTGLAVLSDGVVPIVHGIANFTQISIDKAGADYVLFFQSFSATAVSSAFDIVVGPAKRLFVDKQPGPSVFGVNIMPSPRAVVLDAGNNWVTSSEIEIHARLILPAVFGPSRTTTRLTGMMTQKASAGVAVFDDLTIDNAGSGFRIEFSSVGLDIFVTQPFDVSGPPGVMTVDLDSQWVESGTQATATAPFRYQPRVKISDYGGNIVSYYSLPSGVTASVDGHQQLAGNPVADIIRGVAVFTDLQLRKAVDIGRLNFTYGGPMLSTSVQSPVIVVKAGAPESLDIVRQPSSSSRGMKLGIQPIVQILDSFHNTVTWYSGTVAAKLRLGLENRQDFLAGTPTIGFTENTGVATYTDLNMVLEHDGFHLRFEANGIRVDSETFNIKQGPPNFMIIDNPPIGGVSTVGNGLLQPQPIINVVDSGYGVVESFSGAGRCSGKDCNVSVVLVCCPVNFLGDYSGAGNLLGGTTMTAFNGKATFTDLVIDAPGDYTLRFKVEAIDGISAEISYELASVPVQDFSAMVLLDQPGQALLGEPMRGQPRVQITSSSGLRVNSSYHVIDVTLTAGVGCTGLTGTTSVAASGGLAVFTDLSLATFTGAPDCQFNFSTDNPPMYILSDSFALTYGPASLLLQTEPSGALAGAVFTGQPELEFRDKGNFLLDSESGQTVTAELLQGDNDSLCGGLTCHNFLLGRTTVLNVNGKATFTDLRVDKIHAPGYILLFRMGKYSIYSQKILVSAGTASRLRILTQPKTCQVTLAMPVAPVIEILDGGMNRVNSSEQISARIYPTSFTGITLSNHSTNALKGVATFTGITLSGDAASGVGLEFLGAGLSIVSNTFLAHRPAKALVLQNPMPTTLEAGKTFYPEQRVGLRDDFDFPAVADSSSTIKVKLINKDNNDQVQINDTEIASAGLATFQNLRAFVQGKNYVFRYYFAANSDFYCESSSFSVVASAPNHLAMVQQPKRSVAAETMVPYPSVQMQDEFGNQIISSSGYFVNACVDMAGQCSHAAFLTGTSRLPVTEELLTFSDIALHGTPDSSYKLLFYVTGTGIQNVTAVSNSFELMIGVPLIRIETEPKYAKYGQLFKNQPVVSVSDAAGNTFSGTGGINYLQVTASLFQSSVDEAKLTDSMGDCPCVTRLVDGVAAFSSLQINRAGRDFKLEFSINDLNMKSAVSEHVHVAGDVLHAEISGVPSEIAYETPFKVEVEFWDGNSLPVPVQVLTVKLMDAAGLFLPGLLAGATSVSALSGIGEFNALVLKNMGGPYRLEFNASGYVTSSHAFNVTARNGTHIEILDFPKQLQAVTPLVHAPSLQVLDEYGVVSAFSGNLTVRVLDDMNISLQTPLTVRASDGVGSLSSLQVARTSSGSGGMRLQVEAVLMSQPYMVHSDSFHVTPGRLVALKYVVQPSHGITNEPLRQQPAVNAVDSGGNLLSYFSKQVTVSLNDTSPNNVLNDALHGTKIVRAEHGVVKFTDLAIAKSANAHQFLISTLEACGVLSSSNTFTVTGPLSYISLTGVPTNPDGGILLDPQPQVTFFDQRGVPVSGLVQNVSMSLCSKPEDSVGKIHGQINLPAVEGVVTFTDVSIDRVGTYSVCYTSGSMVLNQTLEVLLGSERYITMLRQPKILSVGKLWSDATPAPKFAVTDAGGNLLDSTSGEIGHLQIEVLDGGTRSKPQMMWCGTCNVEPCFQTGAYDSVANNVGYRSQQLLECKVANPGRGMRMKFSILANNMLLDSVLSDPFDVVSGTCSSLKVIFHPYGVIVGEVFRKPPIVEMRDVGDNPVTWELNRINVELKKPDGNNAQLTGCKSQSGDTPNTNVDGTATFFGCVISCGTPNDMQCLGSDAFRLQFEMDSCDGASLTKANQNQHVETNAFTVSTKPNQVQIKTGTVPTTMASGVMPMQPRIEYWVTPCNGIPSTDGCFVETTDSDLIVSVSIFGASNGATLNGTTTAVVVNGVAQFTDLAIYPASEQNYNISFQAQGCYQLVVSGDHFNRDSSASPTVCETVWHMTSVNVGTAAALIITQQPTPPGPGESFAATVELVDIGGNKVESEELSIAIALDSSFGVSSGIRLTTSDSLSKTTQNGEAEWTGLTVNKAPVIYSFTFSTTKADGTHLEVKSERVSVVIGSQPGEIQFLSQPQDVLSGDTLPAIVAQLYDKGGNKIRLSTEVIVTARIRDADDIEVGTANSSSSLSGEVIFDDLSVSYTTGDNLHIIQLVFGSISRYSNPFFVHLVPAKLILASQPSGWANAGLALPEQPTVEVRDEQENRVYGSGEVINASIVGTGAILQGRTSATSERGLASFTDLRISASGAYTLRFSAAALTEAVSENIEVRSGALASLQIESTYQPGANGTNAAGYSLPLQPRIRLLDSGGAIASPVSILPVRARISEYPPGTNTSMIRTIIGTDYAVPDPLTGVASFTNLAINSVGRFKLEFCLGSLITVSNAFIVEPGAIAQIVFKSQPSPAFFDEILFQQPAVYLMDRGSNPVTGTPWIHISVGQGGTSGSALTGCDEAFAVKDTGVVTFSGCKITGTTSGLHTLLVHTVLTDSSLALESEAFIVCSSPHQVLLKTAASGASAESAFLVQPLVHVVDTQETLIQLRDAVIKVDFGHRNGTLLLGNNEALLRGGIAHFTDLRIDIADSYQLNFTLTFDGIVYSTYQHILVSPGPTNQMVARNWPSMLTSGEIFPPNPHFPEVTLMDSVGNVILHPVEVSISANCEDENGVPCFQGTHTVAASNGVSSFKNLSVHRAGNTTLTLSHAHLSILVQLHVSSGKAAFVRILQQPPPSLLVGAIISPALEIQVEDTYGNVADDVDHPLASVEIYSRPVSEATLSGHLTCTFTGGLCSFDGAGIYINVAGFGFRLIFRTGLLEAISNPFNVHTLPSQIKLMAFPLFGKGGDLLDPQPQIKLFDDAGLPVLNPSFTVTANVEAKTAALVGNTSVVSSGGVAEFTNLKLDKVGIHTLRFECNTGVEIVSVTSPLLTLIPGEPYSISVDVQPGGYATGGVSMPIQPRISLRDAGGNLAESSRTVSVSLEASSTARLGGKVVRSSGSSDDSDESTNSAGALAFTDLNIDSAGQHYLIFSSPGLISAHSNVFDVVVGEAKRLGIIVQPGYANVGQPFLQQPLVQIQDFGGNHVNELAFAVTASIGMHSVPVEKLDSLTLRGIPTMMSVLGWANYTKLQIDVSGLYCSLKFASPGLESVTSDTFIISSLSPASSCLSDIEYLSDCGSTVTKTQMLRVEVEPSNVINGRVFHPTPIIRLRDRDGVVLKAIGNVYASVLSSTGAQLFHGTEEFENGVASFSSMIVDQVGINYRIQFRFEELVATSASFNVTTGPAISTRFSLSLPVEWVVNRILPDFKIELIDHGDFLVTHDDYVHSECHQSEQSHSCLFDKRNISVTVKSGPEIGLLGKDIVSVTSGQASFSGLKFSIAGNYVLRFVCGSCAGFIPLDSDIITVQAYSEPKTIEIVSQAGLPVANFDATANPIETRTYRYDAHPKIQLIDAYGNLVHGFQGHFKVTKHAVGHASVTLGAGKEITLLAVWGSVEFGNLLWRVKSNEARSMAVKLDFGSTWLPEAVVSSGDIALNQEPDVIDVEMATSVQAGEMFEVNVTIKTGDVRLSSYVGTVGITLYDSDGYARTSMAGVLVQRGVTGLVTFTGLSVSAPGSYKIGAFATLSYLYGPMLSKNSSSFTVTVGPPRTLKFLNHTSGCKGGVACMTQPVLQILDASGNTVQQSGVEITAAVVGSSTDKVGCCTNSQQNCPVHDVNCPILGQADSTADPGDPVTATSTAEGIVMFDGISFSTAGSLQVSYSFDAFSIYEMVYVGVGPARRAKIVVLPIGLYAGIPFSRQPIVIASDFGGNWVSMATDNVTTKITLLGCGAGDLGCESFGTLSEEIETGVGRFTDLGTKYAGQMRLEFKLQSVTTCSPANSCWSATQVMQVSSGIPSQLVIISTKTEYFCSGTMTPNWEIEVRDASGNRITSGGPYTVRASSTPLGEVGGTVSNQTSMGQVVFSSLDISKSCYFHSSEADAFLFCYTLTFSLGSITVTSSPFTVMAGPAHDLVFNAQPEQTSIGSPPGYPSVRLVDTRGNPVIPVPSSITKSCGSVDDWSNSNGENLEVTDLSPMLSFEKTDSLSILLGTDESYVSKTSVVFNGLNMNWRVPPCFFPTTCPYSKDDFRRLRLRVSARFGSLVANSDPLAVDVANPVDFMVYQTNFSAIALRWNAPFFGPAPLAFHLRYRYLNAPGAEWTTLAGIKANVYTFSDLHRDSMMEFEICSQSVFDTAQCALRGPAPITAAPVQAVTFAEVLYATETSVLLSWRAPPHGLPPPAYQITVQMLPGGWETVLVSNVSGLNLSIPDLNPNSTYVFGVYSKAAGGDYYAPIGAKTAPVLPTAAASDVLLSCPLDADNKQVCSGHEIVLTWKQPSGALYQPGHYKVLAQQYFQNTSIAFIFEKIYNVSDDWKNGIENTPQTATVTGLVRGRRTRITLLSESINRNELARFAPNVNFHVTPSASPSAPADLALTMENNIDIMASWKTPLDSGDGTPHGVRIESYYILHKREGDPEWIEAEWLGKYNNTRRFNGLVANTSYVFRISAKNEIQLGQRCTIKCTQLPSLPLIGSYIESQFILGQVPYWDPMHSPVRSDPPPLFNVFVGNLFTFSLKAMSSGVSEQISISATGLEECGASLTSVVVGNPATATLALLPAIQHLDRTFWICFSAIDSRGAYSEQRCLQTYVVRPNPTFLAPIDLTKTDPVVRASYTATVGCLLEFNVTAHDLTSGRGILADTASSLGYNCHLKEHRSVIFSRYETRTIEGLPENAVLKAGVAKFANPSTRVFSWRPVRGQEAFDYHVCFTVEDELGTSNTASPAFDGSFCVHISIARCRTCLLPGESLFSIAESYGAEWLNIWAGNSALIRPGEVPATSEIILGPLYKALEHESINSISSRLSVDPGMLKLWNPDLHSAFQERDDVLIQVEQDICVLPSTCTQ